MPIVLHRIDERLIHGQVVVGWGGQLHPDRIVVVDDDLAGSSWEQELYSLGLPPEIMAEFASVRNARERIPKWRISRERVIMLTRDAATMAALARGGLLAGEEINVGGLHHSPGRRQALPYVYLSDAEEDALRELAASGADVSARDLPATRPVTLDQLLQDGTAH
ncbi:MAG TPA: PTS sugar transporter subunit IIB [Longimicrobiales bacterium]|nr:PTS sugar transporter subunit IIB [Longimicrobiales bacterium]